MYGARHTRERVDGKGFDTDDELVLSPAEGNSAGPTRSGVPALSGCGLICN